MAETKTYDLDDDRTESYLAAVAERIGYVTSHSASSTGTPYRTWLAREHDVETEQIGSVPRDWAGMGGDADVGIHAYERPDGGGTEYVAEWTTRVAIDDYVIVSLVFDGRPSKDDIQTAELADQVARKLRRGDLAPTFSCWECGAETHVIDAAGRADDRLPKLRTIVDAGEQRYCHTC